MNPASLRLRPEEAADREFLAELFASTRRAQIQSMGLSGAQAEAFLKMQFEAQYSGYRRQFPAAEFSIVEYAGQAVGRLCLDSRPGTLRVVDVALLPAWCGQGLGGEILQQVLRRALGESCVVRLSVEKHNPAARLYRRLGFQPIGDDGLAWEMEWRAPAATPVSGSAGLQP